MTSDLYASAGVNVPVGDMFSSLCGLMCRESYLNSSFVEVHDFSKGHFRGRRGYSFKNLPPGCIESAGSDGIGTKTIITSAAKTYFKSARDLLAMVGGDFTRDGGLPLIFLNHLDVATLGDGPNHPAFEASEKLMKGLSDAAKKEGYVLLGGETAEMRDCVHSENLDASLKYNWGGVMIGVIHPDKLITGEDLKPNDHVIALRENVRSNGISLLRSGLRKRYGDEWYKNPTGDRLTAIEEAASPSILYDRFLAHMNGWTTDDFEPVIKAKLIAHLSGGGIQSKFGEDLLFPRGLSAVLDKLWEPVDVMRTCAQDLGLSDEKCYEAFGCGQGALVAVDEGDVRVFIAYASEFGIEARDAGIICKDSETPYIRITSGFTGEKFNLYPKP
jgi:phosphoribosylformylglycinamidine cyclo-ligase